MNLESLKTLSPLAFVVAVLWLAELARDKEVLGSILSNSKHCSVKPAVQLHFSKFSAFPRMFLKMLMRFIDSTVDRGLKMSIEPI